MSLVMHQNSPTPWGEQNSQTPWENNNLTSRLACDQAVHLESAANSCANHRQANNVFAICFILEAGSIRRTLGFSGKQNSLFLLGPVILSA